MPVNHYKKLALCLTGRLRNEGDRVQPQQLNTAKPRKQDIERGYYHTSRYDRPAIIPPSECMARNDVLWEDFSKDADSKCRYKNRNPWFGTMPKTLHNDRKGLAARNRAYNQGALFLRSVTVCVEQYTDLTEHPGSILFQPLHHEGPFSVK